MNIAITDVIARDIRFPTSRTLDGSDSVHTDPDYSAAYVSLKTDHPDGLEGHGLTFTIGQGNELCVAGIRALAPLVRGKTLQSFTDDLGAFWRMLTNHSQLRWVGPEKGVIHLATAALFETTLRVLITYDVRMASAAQAFGWTVSAPS